jgi:hypothetical protein
VLFDTNVLYTGSASDLVRLEAANLIRDSVFPDLEIHWYLPEVVRHERQYQMQKRALEMLPTLARLEKLLGHNLAVTEQVLIDSVEKAVSDRQTELGFISLPTDYSKIDWNRVVLDAAYRKPPFQDGETEKGFRDRIIVECFLQLVTDSPKTPHVCRIVLLTNDKLVTEAVQARSTGSTNVSVLPTLEELKGLINTLVSQVDEAFLTLLRPKAEKLFFVPKEQSTLFYKENIQAELEQRFAGELVVLPPGATSRTNGTWRINAPNFVKKTGRRIQWASRISVEVEASKTIARSPATEHSEWISGQNIFLSPNPKSVPLASLANSDIYSFAPVTSLAKGISIGPLNTYSFNVGYSESVTTHKGVVLPSKTGHLI